MKRITLLLSVALVLALSVVPVFATETTNETTTETGSLTYPDVYVTVEDYTPQVSVNDVIVVDTVARSPLILVVEELFGEYTPKTYAVTTYFSDGTSVSSVEYVPGLAGLDWVWLSGVGLFVLFLYCVLRMIGGVLKWT